MNTYQMLVCVGIVLIQVNGANAQFGDMGNLLNKKLNKLKTPTNQPPVAVSDTTPMAQPPTSQPAPTTDTSGGTSTNINGTVINPQQPPSDGTAQNKQNTTTEASKDQSITPEKVAETPTYDQVVELKKAMYGIPLGSNLDEIGKWYEEKNVQVTGATKSQIDEACKLTLNRAKRDGLFQNIEIGESAIEYDKLEQEVAQISSTPAGHDQNTRGLLKSLRSVCELIKNPTIAYKGTTFILESISSLAPCKAYQLVLLPSEEMKKDDIQWIRVFLYKKGNDLVSYGAAVACGDYDPKKFSDALTKKYGEPKSGIRKRIEELRRITDLEKVVFSHQWRENIVMTDSGGNRGVVVFYYIPNVTKQLVIEQDASIRKMQEDEKRQEQKAQEKLKDNF